MPLSTNAKTAAEMRDEIVSYIVARVATELSFANMSNSVGVRKNHQEAAAVLRSLSIDIAAIKIEP